MLCDIVVFAIPLQFALILVLLSSTARLYLYLHFCQCLSTLSGPIRPSARSSIPFPSSSAAPWPQLHLPLAIVSRPPLCLRHLWAAIVGTQVLLLPRPIGHKGTEKEARRKKTRRRKGRAGAASNLQWLQIQQSELQWQPDYLTSSPQCRELLGVVSARMRAPTNLVLVALSLDFLLSSFLPRNALPISIPTLSFALSSCGVFGSLSVPASSPLSPTPTRPSPGSFPRYLPSGLVLVRLCRALVTLLRLGA